MVKQLVFAETLVTAKTPKSSSWQLLPVQVDFGLSASLPQRSVRECSVAQLVYDYQDNPLQKPPSPSPEMATIF